jgi:hypothetical protein
MARHLFCVLTLLLYPFMTFAAPPEPALSAGAESYGKTERSVVTETGVRMMLTLAIPLATVVGGCAAVKFALADGTLSAGEFALISWLAGFGAFTTVCAQGQRGTPEYEKAKSDIIDLYLLRKAAERIAVLLEKLPQIASRDPELAPFFSSNEQPSEVPSTRAEFMSLWTKFEKSWRARQWIRAFAAAVANFNKSYNVARNKEPLVSFGADSPLIEYRQACAAFLISRRLFRSSPY